MAATGTYHGITSTVTVISDLLAAKLQAPSTILVAGDMSGNLSATPYALNGCKRVSVRCSAASNTHVGTFAFSVSHTGLDADKVALTLTSTITASSGSALNALVELDVYGAYLHVDYIFTSGAGTLAVTAMAKE